MAGAAGRGAGPATPASGNAVAGVAGRPAMAAASQDGGGGTTGEDRCPVSLRVLAGDRSELRVRRGALTMLGHFLVHGQFPKDCGCAGYEYRQFIRGQVHHLRGGRLFQDLGSQFALPGGGLSNSFVEDGDTVTGFRYGHRADEPNFNPKSFYTDDAGKLDQARGCRFEGSDLPGLAGLPVTSGDVVDANIVFRGEIQRGGKVVATQNWVGLRRQYQIP
jgi:hypothetical protein